MELLEFDLERLESGLTLLQYELIKPIAKQLLEKGYPPERVAALMFRYGMVLQRKIIKERKRQRMENQIKAKEQETESQTSGENEGSV